jgi:hypothetical protein
MSELVINNCENCKDLINENEALQAEVDRLKAENEYLADINKVFKEKDKGYVELQDTIDVSLTLHVKTEHLEELNADLVKTLNTVDECVQVLSMLNNVDVGDVRRYIKQALAKTEGKED